MEYLGNQVDGRVWSEDPTLRNPLEDDNTKGGEHSRGDEFPMDDECLEEMMQSMPVPAEEEPLGSNWQPHSGTLRHSAILAILVKKTYFTTKAQGWIHQRSRQESFGRWQTKKRCLEILEISSQQKYPSQTIMPFQKSVAPLGNLRPTTSFATEAHWSSWGDTSTQSTMEQGQWQQRRAPARARSMPFPTHHKLNREALTTWVYPTNLGATEAPASAIPASWILPLELPGIPKSLHKSPEAMEITATPSPTNMPTNVLREHLFSGERLSHHSWLSVQYCSQKPLSQCARCFRTFHAVRTQTPHKGSAYETVPDSP